MITTFLDNNSMRHLEEMFDVILEHSDELNSWERDFIDNNYAKFEADKNIVFSDKVMENLERIYNNFNK